MAENKNKAPQLSSLGPAELRAELHKAQTERAKLRFQHQTAPLKNPMELRRLRREIARLKTHIRSKEAAK